MLHLYSAIFFAALLIPTAKSQNVKYCSLPDATGTFETATGTEANINITIANQAIATFSQNGAVSIKIFRHNCLVAQSPSSSSTDAVKKNIFSATKGVISILTGIAHDQGKLQLDDSIGLYLPNAPGWGDTAHRNITIHQLLTETAGTSAGLVSEAITVLLDQSLPQQALAQPIIHPPGSTFVYSQRVPDLLAYVVSQAVGQDLQTFAQTYLFTPIGIPASKYVWLRDRSGNSYGFAYLYLDSLSFARLGLMMQNGGTWNGQRVLSASYVNSVSVPSPTNPCYGRLFWTNRGTSCLSPSGYFFNRSWCPSTPPDNFAMSGSPQQKNFMIPSLNMTVSWAGVLTDSSPPANTWYEFFKILMSGVTDIAPIDPKTYEVEPYNPVAVWMSMDLSVLLANVLSSPQCNVLICNGEIPLFGLIVNIGNLLRLLN